ncbi:ABC transporter substrate-binding protein [Thermostilla marina]
MIRHTCDVIDRRPEIRDGGGMEPRRKPRRAPLRGMTAWGWKSLVWFFCVLVLGVLPGPVSLRAQETEPQGVAESEVPLYDRLPYDEIQLDAANDNLILKVEPIEWPDGRFPETLPKQGFLEVELVDKPGEKYRVAWPHVVEVRPFPQLILNEASRLIDEKKFESAFDHLLFMIDNYPEWPGRDEVYAKLLLAESQDFVDRHVYDRALADLERLYELDAEYPGLQETYSLAIDKLIEDYVSRNEVPAARELLERLESHYPDDPAVAKWRQRWIAEATKLAEQLRAALEAGRDREAASSARKVLQIWPALPGIAEPVQEAFRRFPRVRVGVLGFADIQDPASLCDWNARRTGRLLYRTLMEFTGPGQEGGTYVCPWGTLRIENLGARLSLTLETERPFPNAAELTFSAADLASYMLAMTSPESAQYAPQWASIVERVATREGRVVDVDLRHAFVRPEGLLRCRIGPWVMVGANWHDEEPPGTGPYTPVPSLSNERERVFQELAGYAAKEAAQPAEIVEEYFARGRDGLRALRRGEVDIVDRINPWELPMVREEPGIVVEQYAVPLVHCLVPNLERPLAGNRDLRRAIVYGINRERILNNLLGGSETPGCQVVSGPFAQGVSFDDPLDYAYDDTIEPRPYDPALALALGEVAFSQAAAKAEKGGEPFPDSLELTIGHPPTELAAEACSEIEEQLELLGMEIELVPMTYSQWQTQGDEIDFYYCEVAMWEPIVDVYRLLGKGGPVRGEVSPYLLQAMDELAEAVDWREIGRRLRKIHRLVHDDVTIIPLWQLRDYYAYRNRLDPGGRQPVVLYQSVEKWRIQPPMLETQ